MRLALWTKGQVIDYAHEAHNNSLAAIGGDFLDNNDVDAFSSQSQQTIDGTSDCLADAGSREASGDPS